MAVRRRVEEEMAGKPSSPWPAEAWVRARKAYSAGVVKPERRFPVVLTDVGPFTTPEDVLRVVGMESVPEVKWTVKTEFSMEDSDYDENDDEEKEKERQSSREERAATEMETGEKVRCCDVNQRQLALVEEYSSGENILVWFRNKKRFAWVAYDTA